jgi:hypothetical protein
VEGGLLMQMIPALEAILDPLLAMDSSVTAKGADIQDRLKVVSLSKASPSHLLSHGPFGACDG